MTQRSYCCARSGCGLFDNESSDCSTAQALCHRGVPKLVEDVPPVARGQGRAGVHSDAIAARDAEYAEYLDASPSLDRRGHP